MNRMAFDQLRKDIHGNYMGPSTVTKPDAPVGAIFDETDTGRRFIRRNVSGSDVWQRLHADLDTAGLIEAGIMRPVTASYNAPSPPIGVGQAVEVPTTALFRVVFGNYSLTGATLAAAGISAAVSTPEAPTSYTTGLAPGAAKALESTSPAFSFIVRPGGRYYFAAAGTGNVETVGSYNYLDVMK